MMEERDLEILKDGAIRMDWPYEERRPRLHL
jgi:hypothetical protein